MSFRRYQTTVKLGARDDRYVNEISTLYVTRVESTLNFVEALNSVSNSGDTMTGSLDIASSYPSDDIEGGIDGTNRLNLHSYQRANRNTYGETIRHFLMRKDAKAMEAYYVPKLGYNLDKTPKATLDADGNPADITEWQPVSWTGSHFEANDHNSNHVHWELEIPDSNGALQGRLEVPFADPNTETIGLDKTFIRTNLADLVVRTSNNQMLRLSSPAGNHKPIEFNHDSEGSTEFRRWTLRANSTAESGGDAGTDLQIVRYGDSGNYIDSAMFIKRKTGNIGIGTTSPATKLDINGDSLRVRNKKTINSSNAAGTQGEICWDDNYIYVCVASNTWKRAALGSW